MGICNGLDESTSTHPTQFGNYWVNETYQERLASILEPEALKWMAKLLVASTSSAGEAWSERFSSSMSDLKNKRVAAGISGSGNPLAAEPTSGQSGEQYLSEVPYEFSAQFKGKTEMQIAGPDDVQLAMHAAPDRYTMALLGGSGIRPATDCNLWSIHNGALRSLPEIRLEISSTKVSMIESLRFESRSISAFDGWF